ncbi:TetR/AcrR family transcriptional regulator [Streptomyces prasinus]
MPKINASTVAEHRAQQREALIGAAIDILVNEGATAVTPAAVGARAGLARSSVYQYFDSSAALLATITEEAFRRSNEALATAMAEASGPVARVEAFFRESLRLGAEGAHRPAAALMSAGLPPACQERLMELHLEQVEPFRAAVREIGSPDPALTADLIAGMLHTALAAVDRGTPLDTVTERTLALVRRCLSPADSTVRGAPSGGARAGGTAPAG